MKAGYRGTKLLIAGNGTREHVGTHFLHAAAELNLPMQFADVRTANGDPLTRRICWHLMKRRPARLGAFSARIVGLCADHKPEILLTTGFAPITAAALKTVGSMGICRMNYLTDDPWNPTQRAPWFMEALPEYDEIFSTRRANLGDLRALGCKGVSYLPFGFAPDLYFPDSPSPERKAEAESDVLFAGGADADRLPYIKALSAEGFKLGLYGAYWERFAETRALTRGYQPPATVREAVAAAKVVLCLVRRANRDGTCMRSFEAPAMGACMLTEKTEEHLDLFGPEGQTVLYFESIGEMIEKARWLVEHEAERRRLKAAAHRLISEGRHTYQDRLATIVERASSRLFSANPVLCSARQRA
ncbi:MAG TPA: glycosyltransferase [Bryobacteraceae bacterium]|nr:glycosyltransferase [Bryobacteraceae bacterium]